MKKTRFINARRRLFTQRAVLASASVAAAGAVAADGQAVPSPAGSERKSTDPAQLSARGYQETEQVLRYYEMARF